MYVQCFDMGSKENAVKAITSPTQLRNVVLVGSQGSGKTTLFEHLMKYSFEGFRGVKKDAERAASLVGTAIPVRDSVINILDAPGHPDHVGELRAGLQAADAAVFVVSAADGLDAVTTSLWRECRDAQVPRIIVVTKLDAERGNYFDTVSLCQQELGDGVHPSFVPFTNDAGEIIGNMSLVTYRVNDYTSGQREQRDATKEEIDKIRQYQEQYMESLIIESDDEELFSTYEPGEKVKIDIVLKDLDKAMRSGRFHPVMPVLSTNGVGTAELLKMIDAAFPYPKIHVGESVTKDGTEFELESNPGGVLAAQVIRTTSDQYAGRQSLVRVLSGTLKTDSTVKVIRNNELFTGEEDPHAHETEAKVGQISMLVGTELVSKSEAIAGEIVLISKMDAANTGDTITSAENPIIVAPWEIPAPQLPIAIKAATRNDEDKLSGALQRLAIEDASVVIQRSDETDQLILWCAGQAHADLLLNRLQDRYQVKVEQEPVKIGLRETFIKPAKGHGRHVKQSGGHGQFGDCFIEVNPGPRGSGFEFIDKVVGGAVPRQFIPSVEKGIQNLIAKGVISDYPMVDIQVTLYDGKAHSVDSSDMAFQMAGQLAIKDAANRENVALLEPIDQIEVRVGEEFMGAIMTDISNRRGQVLGSDTRADHQVSVTALVPQAELTRYAIDLRGLAQGTGSFTRTFHGYQLMPQNIAEQYYKD